MENEEYIIFSSLILSVISFKPWKQQPKHFVLWYLRELETFYQQETLPAVTMVTLVIDI